MKRVTASEARRNWFRLLDEVLEGEVVAIIRRGKRIVLRREPGAETQRKVPDYDAILTVRDVDSADTWTWEWGGPEQDLTLRGGRDE